MPASPWDSMEATILAAENEVSDLEATFAASDFYAKPRSEIYSRGHSRSGVAAKAKRLMMSQQVETRHSRIAATYKAREVEGAVDVYFYRPLGFRLAEFFAHLKLTPAGVSLLAGVCGVIAGHLYFYRNLGINIAGMVLHVCANALDNADGQLARLTHQESRKGRIIDSVSDHLVFASVYIHLTLRCAFAGASPAIWLLALGAAISHALQGAAADYYRSTYLYFTSAARTELHSSSALR